MHGLSNSPIGGKAAPSHHIKSHWSCNTKPSTPPGIQVAFAVGVLCALVAGLPYHYYPSCSVLGELQVPWWRVMVAIGVLPAALQLLTLCWCPESPGWLEKTDKDKVTGWWW